MYCVGGEFSMPASNVVTVRFAQSSHLTFQIDPEYPQSQPQLSAWLGLLSRQHNEKFLESLRCFVLSLPEGGQKMVQTIDFAREKYQLMETEERKEAQIVEEPRELLVIKIDHMRNSADYVKTLEKWCDQLAVRAVLLISSDLGLVFILEGQKSNTAHFIINWKTTNIDVDIRGKPCKERMITILHRSSLGKDEAMLGELSKEMFRVIKVDVIMSVFENKKIASIMESVLIK